MRFVFNFPRLRKLLSWLPRGRLAKACGLLSGLVTCGALLLILGDRRIAQDSAGKIYAYIADVPPAEVALVLGTSKYVGRRRNLYYQPRIDAAAELFKRGKVKAIVVSGDNGRKDYNEPKQMKNDLVALGIPERFITCDYAGFDTLDSIHRIYRIFQQNEYVIVSQRFHVERALFIARELGHDAVGFPVQGPSGVSGSKVRAREVLARAKALVQVKVLHSGPKYLGKKEFVAKREF